MIKYLIIIPALLLLAVLAAVVRTLLRPRKKSDYKPHENEEEALRLAEKLTEICFFTGRAKAPKSRYSL